MDKFTLTGRLHDASGATVPTGQFVTAVMANIEGLPEPGTPNFYGRNSFAETDAAGVFSFELVTVDGLEYDVMSSHGQTLTPSRIPAGTPGEIVNLGDVAAQSRPSSAVQLLRGLPGPTGPKGETAPKAGPRVVTMGDSINAAGQFALHGTTWTAALCELTDQQALTFVGNTAVGGENVTQIAARIGEALALRPDIVTLTAGANDAGTTPLATFQTKITLIADAMRDDRVRLVLTTITPLPAHPGLHETLAEWNDWLHLFAAERQLDLLDFHSLLTDGADGFAPGYDSGDGIHPSQAAHVAMAELARQLLAPSTTSPLDPSNIVPNPMFTEGVAVPDGWAWTPAAGYTGTLVVDPEFAGRAFKITAAGAAGGLAQFNTALLPVTAGRRYEISALNRIDASTATPAPFKGLRLEAWFNVGPLMPIVQGIVTERGRARWRYEITVPEGVTGMYLVMLVNAIQAGETFTCHVGEPVVRKLP